MSINPHKTISANSGGIIISFRDVNKHQWLPFDSQAVKSVQINGTVKYQKLETPVFNKYQDKLYAEAMHGLKAYSEKELSKMPVRLKDKIQMVASKAQYVLNNWKQEIVNQRVDNLLLTLFPHSKTVKQIAAVKGTDPSYYNQQTFKQLGISKKSIAEKLVQTRVLPENFFNLA